MIESLDSAEEAFVISVGVVGKVIWSVDRIVPVLVHAGPPQFRGLKVEDENWLARPKAQLVIQ